MHISERVLDEYLITCSFQYIRQMRVVNYRPIALRVNYNRGSTVRIYMSTLYSAPVSIATVAELVAIN